MNNNTDLSTISLPSNVIRHLFRNVYFINGTAYAGKSTMIHMLAEKYDGIECGENYHDVLMDTIGAEHQPNLSYFDAMKDWQEFLNRTPDAYDSWITGTSREAGELEIIRLLQLTMDDKFSASPGRKIFVDTNIVPEILWQISDYQHVAVMLSPQSMSVDRWFDRIDPEKQFLLQQIQAAEDPERTMANFRACLARLNSPEHYAELAESGFFTWVRTEDTTIEETLTALEKHFGL